MPASPSATASTEAIHSCVFVASTSGARDRVEPVVSGCQNGANWRKPPIAASTASTPTGQRIESGPSLPVMQVEVLARERRRLAGEDDEVEAERVEAGQERADQAGDEEHDRRTRRGRARRR